jgi:hypothetical protein
MLITLLAVLLQDAASYEDPAKEIQWARTWDEAFAEAKLRSVPVLIFLTSDN